MVADHLRTTGESCSPRQIAASAEGGCHAATATLGRYVERLGRSLAMVVNIIDPDVIVLGGGMSNLPDLPESASRAMALHLFTDHPDVLVRRNLHGDSSGVRGAAWLGAD